MGSSVFTALNQAAEDAEGSDAVSDLPNFKGQRGAPQTAFDAECLYGAIDTTKVDVGRLAPRILAAQRRIPVESARAVHLMRNAHDCYVRALVWDPFRDLLISGGGDGWIKVWRTDSFSLEQELDATLSVRSLLVLTQELASGHSNGEVILWAMEKPGHPITERLKAHQEAVYAMVMLRSGELVTGAEDIRIFSRNGRGGFQLVASVAEEVLCMCTVPGGEGGTQVVTGNMNGLITVWDTTCGQWKADAHCRGHERSVWAIVYVRDAQVCASGSADQTLRIWNPSTWQCMRVLKDHGGWVVGLSSGPGWLLSCSIDQTVRAWDVRNFNCARVFNEQKYEVYCVCAFAGGRFCTGGAEMSIIIYSGPDDSRGGFPAYGQHAEDPRDRRAQLMANSGLDMSMGGYRDQIERHLGGPQQQPQQQRPASSGGLRSPRGSDQRRAPSPRGGPPSPRASSPRASSPRARSPGGEARARSPRPPAAAAGGPPSEVRRAQVFSATLGRWIDARVTKIEAGTVTVVYKFPDGNEAMKQLPVGHEHVRLLDEPMPPPSTGSYRVGSQVEVYSSTQQRWVRARVTQVENGWVTVVYSFPDGGEGTKQLPVDHEQLRPLNAERSEPPGPRSPRAAPRSPRGGAPRSPRGGGVMEWSSQLLSRGDGVR